MNILIIIQVKEKKKTSKWDEFYKVYINIKNNGFKKKYNDIDPIIIKNNICRHGRHRICMLKFIYGKNLKIELKNDTIHKLIF